MSVMNTDTASSRSLQERRSQSKASGRESEMVSVVSGEWEEPWGRPDTTVISSSDPKTDTCSYATSFSSYQTSDSNLDTTPSGNETNTNTNKQSFCSLSRLKTKLGRRTLRGKGVILVLLLNVLQSMAFFGIVETVYQFLFGSTFYYSMAGSAVQLILRNTVAKITFPVSGFLADVYFGRHRVIRASLWLLWIALAILSLSISLNGVSDKQWVVTTTRFVLPILALVLISAGSGGFQANLIPFGVDQLEGVPADKLSSYFHWYYWGVNLGGFLGFVCLFTLTTMLPANMIKSMFTLTAVATLSLALILHVLLASWFDVDNQTQNPLKLVVNVLWYAATVKRTLPRSRIAFRYGERPPPRIELAKMEYDGIYAHEEVEDVKTFCLILLVTFSLGGYDLTYSGLFGMMSYQMKNLTVMVTGSTTSRYTYLLQNLTILVNVLTIVILIPLLNHIVYPLLDNYTPNMRKRIGIGTFLAIPLVVSLVLIEGFEVHAGLDASVQIYSFIFPAVLLSVSEVFTYVTVFEFIIAQSPHRTKGFLIGLRYSLLGLWSAVAGVIFLVAPESEDLCSVSSSFGMNSIGNNCIFWYYVYYAIIAVIGFVLYIVVAILYQNRRRDNVVNENARISSYYSFGSDT